MEDLLTSIDRKLDIVIYCLVALIIVAFVRIVLLYISHFKNQAEPLENAHYAKLLKNEKYLQILKLADDDLDLNPNALWPNWYKAISLYKLQRYDQARNTFETIQIIEPSWENTIAPYINAIEKTEQSRTA